MQFVKTVYEDQCSDDYCNCYLHSVNNVEQCDDFEKLTPFIEYVDKIHDSSEELTKNALSIYATRYEKVKQVDFFGNKPKVQMADKGKNDLLSRLRVFFVEFNNIDTVAGYRAMQEKARQYEEELDTYIGEI